MQYLIVPLLILRLGLLIADALSESSSIKTDFPLSFDAVSLLTDNYIESFPMVKANNLEEKRARKEHLFACSEQYGTRKKTYLAKLDFYHTFPKFDGSSPTWFKLNLFSQTIGNPAELTYGKCGAILNTKVYKDLFPLIPTDRWEPDRYKWLALVKEPLPVPRTGLMVISFVGSTQTYGVHQNPFPLELISWYGDDVRLASGTFNVYDMNTGLAFDYYLTNDRVYVAYGRTSLARTTANFYAAFLFLIPVKMRKPRDIHKMEVILSPADRKVTWVLDRRPVFCVNRVGYLLDRQYMVADHGGNIAPAFPESIRYGFGSATLLDTYPACQSSPKCKQCKFPTLRQALVKTAVNPVRPQLNPLLGFNYPAIYYDQIPTPYNRYWGQGSTSQLRSLVVYTLEDPCPRY